MDLLILGGSWFVGRVIADDAVARGWNVTVFNRGRSASSPEGVHTIHGDRESAHDLARLAEAGPWDAVIDVAGTVPTMVRDAARALRPATNRYALVSSVSVYTGWPAEPVTEASPLHDGDPDRSDEEGPTHTYGAMKVGCEAAVRREFASDRVLIVRPGVVLGPHEYVGRLKWWLNRALRGGRILAPGRPDRPIQPIDVRDLAAFVLDRIADGGSGTFNLAPPADSSTYRDLLVACLEATGGRGELLWIDEEWLAAQDVRQWTELPLWRVPPGTWAMDTKRATAAGLTCRPLAETVHDTWGWLSAGGRAVDHERDAEHGIDPQKERALLESAETEEAVRLREAFPG
ncbi:NAD-dependent epimerase/dehydratase family protein [Actinoplanes sichuanensis]|uniref:NAD-dependent epimerase/dehydratase family protein n=1 Tax=Actinoplanes sichuanensis TaxID=512349 RepID=A0ABW4ARE6_9ACTN|nr:NAD-dependent epimerase/dehydratase family protein [Actinoplanes sichuanensis]